MKELSFEALRQELQRLISSTQTLSIYYYSFFCDLYATGLRFEELRNPTAVIAHDNDTVTFACEKGSYNRTFNRNSLSSYFNDRLDQGKEAYQYLTNDSASRLFLRFTINKRFWVGTKRESNHLFRHHYAKNLHNQELSDQEIQIMMGEVSIENARSYIYSSILIQ